MMEYKAKVRALLIVNALLAAAILGGIAYDGVRASGRRLARRIVDDPSKVDAIALSSGEGLVLKRSGGAWIAVRGGDSLPALSARVDAFLALLADDSRMDVVAGSLESRTELGLGPGDARAVRLMGADGSTLAELLVGAYAPSGGSAYLAFAGSEAALLAPGAIAAYAGASAVSWLDLAAFSPGIDARTVESLRVEVSLPDAGLPARPGYAIVRSGQGWAESPGGRELDPARVESMIRSLLALQASDYAPGKEASGDTACTVRMALSNGAETWLRLEKAAEDGSYPASTSSGRGRMYLPAWAVKEAVKDLAALMPAGKP